MTEPVWYHNKETQSGTIGMLLCRTQIPDQEMAMPSSQRTPELQVATTAVCSEYSVARYKKDTAKACGLGKIHYIYIST